MESTCFIICPISKEGSKVREHADLLLEYVIDPACQILNLNAVRNDEIATSGFITDAIIKYLRDSKFVIADITNSNPNVFYELGIRHGLNKHTILIQERDKTKPFDIQSINIIEYGPLNDHREIKKLTDRIIKSINKIKTSSDTSDLPYNNLLSDHSKIESVYLEKSDEILKGVKGFKQYLVNNFTSDIEEKTKINAQYIDGEHDAFSALTEATNNAKRTIRSTRFFPDSVLGNQEYVKAIESRVLGSDNKPPLKKYYRIISLNNKEKIRDVLHILNTFQGKPYELHLTTKRNAFELVVIDNTDVFIHFYKDKKVIASTLHIKERSIVKEFKVIYDKMFTDTSHNLYFNCQDINLNNLSENMTKTHEIFAEMFTSE